MKTSDKIKTRLSKDGKRWYANDNIARYIKEGELDDLQEEVELAMEDVLRALVIDTKRDHNTKETAKRIAKMFIRETFNGRYRKTPKITAFPNVGYKGIYASGPISIRSTCAHHFQNIVGNCWIGIIPKTEVIGLSKFSRLVHWIAERPQIQEEMTTKISDAIKFHAKTEDVAVVVKAEHHCMTHRGVKEHESDMTTSVMSGRFMDDAATRKEFYDICFSMKGHR